MFNRGLTLKERTKEEKKKAREEGKTKNSKTRTMSYKCNGLNVDGRRCKQSVPGSNDYCFKHEEQAKDRKMCKCFLQSGSQCPYLASNNDFCEYHQEPKYCQGNTILGDKCLKAIDGGYYCSVCKTQEGVIQQSIKTSADEFRGFLMREGKMAIPLKKSATVNIVATKIEIPSDLKKVPLVKPDSCCICLEDMLNKYIILKCGHYFHNECLSKQISMTCSLCRAPIDVWKVPQWVVLRIEENRKEAEREKIIEQTQNTQQLIQQIVGREILGGVLEDFGSTEEEDFQQNIREGRPMNLMAVTDERGQHRLAIVFSGSPQ